MLKSLQVLRRAVPQRSLVRFQLAALSQFRMFSKKSKSGNSSGEESDKSRKKSKKLKKAEEQKVMMAETVQQQAQAVKSSPEFSVGDVKVIKSTPNHQPPLKEDSLTGRYATVLFMSASQNEELFNVYEDMSYLIHLQSESQSFRLHTENIGVSLTEHNNFKEALGHITKFSDSTYNFLDVLFEQKRMMFLTTIANKFIKLYQMFNQEEKIRIISAFELTQSEKDQVKEAMMSNKNNAGKQFTISYEVDKSIIGGLQLYTESKFMDLSVQSRLEKISGEIQKLSQA